VQGSHVRYVPREHAAGYLLGNLDDLLEIGRLWMRREWHLVAESRLVPIVQTVRDVPRLLALKVPPDGTALAGKLAPERDGLQAARSELGDGAVGGDGREERHVGDGLVPGHAQVDAGDGGTYLRRLEERVRDSGLRDELVEPVGDGLRYLQVRHLAEEQVGARLRDLGGERDMQWRRLSHTGRLTLPSPEEERSRVAVLGRRSSLGRELRRVAGVPCPPRADGGRDGAARRPCHVGIAGKRTHAAISFCAS